MLRGGDLGQAVLLAPCLHLQEREQRPDLLLDVVQADEGVEIGQHQREWPSRWREATEQLLDAA
ncbi:hypothetical protein SAMN06264364_11016 [Quadrisphaera granulorum]|uniref:Uncharacterized protein n=1 Tax=Quadrisphaera granulorum TaxID=317664 RepID=A0A316A824_9ACTN|nr:hypothetical protein BXY45_11016 [Quadrisphaera granulorum]SZE96530.1 hypothetical protein SAMN06264364_11016 [Quadrisphaera granulorum]